MLKFSIIIPIYSIADYLKTCMASLLCQADESIEIILVDDGSRDESPALCDAYAAEFPSVVRVIHQENAGAGGARNTGVAAARGEYILFVDADDYLSPTSLKILSKALEEKPCDLLCFNFYNVIDGQAEAFCAELPYDRRFCLSDTPELLFVMPSVWGFAWKRSFYLECGLSFTARVWYEDIRILLKFFALTDNVRAIPDPLYYYVHREGSTMNNKNIDRNAEIIDAIDDIFAWYKQKGLFEQYRQELTRIAIEHLYIAASTRVLRTKASHPLLTRLRDYMEQNLPDYRKCPLIKDLGVKMRVVFGLLELRQYRLIRLITVVNSYRKKLFRKEMNF